MKNLGIFDCVKARKGFFVCLVCLNIAVIGLAVYSAFNFGNLSISLDLGNVGYLKFLRGEVGFVSLVFSFVLLIGIFVGIILVTGKKRFTILIAILFELYYVYTQVVIFVSIILIYGLFNTLILVVFLMAFLLVQFALLMLILCEASCKCNSETYFRDCFDKGSSKIPLFCLCLLVLTLIFCVFLSILKTYILLLVF